jgi:hypothetical protein
VAACLNKVGGESAKHSSMWGNVRRVTVYLVGNLSANTLRATPQSCLSPSCNSITIIYVQRLENPDDIMQVGVIASKSCMMSSK